ncbi:MAG: Rha family transcriptional regulator [Bacillota bacterium]
MCSLFGVSQVFNLHNFGEITYTDSRNREQKAYEITKDGFSFLVMGYTGEKAAQFKENFIKVFKQKVYK